MPRHSVQFDAAAGEDARAPGGGLAGEPPALRGRAGARGRLREARQALAIAAIGMTFASAAGGWTANHARASASVARAR